MGILQDLFVGLQLAFLGPFASLVHLLILYDALLMQKTGHRLHLKTFSFALHAKEFRDSARALGMWKWLPLFLGVALLPVFFSAPSYWVLLGIPLWFFPPDSLVLLWEVELVRRPFYAKKGNFASFIQKEIIRPTEIYRPLSPTYPLYRYTEGFRGEKIAKVKAQGKPHIIFLFVESLRAKDLHRLPYLSRLKEESLFFSHFYANSVLTFRTFFTALYGLPYELGISAGLDRNLDVYGLPDLLKEKGYTRNFFTGATWSLNGIGPFLAKYGGDIVYDRRELMQHFGEVDQSSWGVADEYLFEFTLDHLKKHSETPQFYTLLTISSHHPWNVPKHYQGPTFGEEPGEYTPKYLQTLHYTDACIGHFLKELEDEEVLLFITGDHGCFLGENDAGFEYKRGVHPDNFHVPLMIYGKGRTEGQQIDTWGSHADFLPTILDLFEWRGKHHSIGKSLLRREDRAPVFYHNPSHQAGKVYAKNAQPEVVETFEEMMKMLFQSGALAPPSSRESLSLVPFEPSIHLDRSALIAAIRQASPLVTLNLNGHPEVDDSLLRSLAPWNPGLEHLSLNQSLRLTDRGVQEVIRQCPGLVSLDLSHCPLLTQKCLETLPETFYALNLAGTDISFQKSIKDLEILKVERTPFSSEELRKLPKLCPHLLTLQLSYSPFTGKEIREAIEHLPLYRLTLDECDALEDQEAQELLAPHPHLRFLHLERCHHLTDALFLSLKECRLRHLSLRGAYRLTDRGLEALLKLPLDALEIQGCANFTDRGLAAVEAAQEKFSKLQINT